MIMLSLFGKKTCKHITIDLCLLYNSFFFSISNAKVSSIFGSTEINYETWKPVKYLRGHESGMNLEITDTKSLTSSPI